MSSKICLDADVALQAIKPTLNFGKIIRSSRLDLRILYSGSSILSHLKLHKPVASAAGEKSIVF